MNHATSHRSFPTALAKAIVLSCILTTVGCEYRSTALEDRMKDFQYSTEKLGEEVTKRLKSAHLGEPRQSKSRNTRASKVSQMEADRGGDGNRPDPNSVEAIVSDCAAKIRLIEEQGSDTNVVDSIIRQVEEAKDIKTDVREAFTTELREELAAASS